MDARPIDAGKVGGEFVISEVGSCWLWLHGKVLDRKCEGVGDWKEAGKISSYFPLGSFV